MPSLAAAVGLLEEGRIESAAEALGALAGPSREGVIARFRHAECLSRLARHEEAVAAARRAFEDAPQSSAAGLWLAQTLAEAGRDAEAGQLKLPTTDVESLEPLRAGFAALARVAAGDRGDADATVKTILETRHGPLYSLALRRAEALRLADAGHRGPDLVTVYGRMQCRFEMECDRQTEHPSRPEIPAGGFRALPGDHGSAAGYVVGALVRTAVSLSGGERTLRAIRWVHLHHACGDHTELARALRAACPHSATLDEAEIELLLSLGRLDDARKLIARVAADAGDDAAGELAVLRARLAFLEGGAARADDFAGGDDARLRLGQMCAWLDTCAALVAGDERAARTAADATADTSKREFVEAALERWKTPPAA